MKGKTVSRRGSHIAIALAGVLALPALASAEPVSETAVRIEIDTSALREDEQLETEQWVTDKQTAVLKEAGFVVSDDAEHVIRIEISRYGEFGVHAKGRLMLIGDEGSVREFVCEMCGVSQFLARVDEHTALVAERLRSNLAEENEPAALGQLDEVAGDGDGDGAEVEPDDGAESTGGEEIIDEPAPRERRPLGPLGKAGIGVGVAGAGIAIGGLVLLPREFVTSGSAGGLKGYSPHKVGIGLAAGGGVVLAAGISMLVVDLVRGRPSKVALLPYRGVHHAGVTLTLRF